MSGPSLELNHTVVRAGAGAGKTHGLVEKVVSVYSTYRAQGLKPRIVVTTFTRKATQELKERLTLKACELKDADLLQFVSDASKLHISTIHGLLNVFLKQVGHLAGLDAGFVVMSPSEGARLSRLALREVLVQHPDHLEWLESYGFERILEMCQQYERFRLEKGSLVPIEESDLLEDRRAVVEAWRERWREVADALLERSGGDAKWEAYAQALSQHLARWQGDLAETENWPDKPRASAKKPDPWADWHERINELKKEFKAQMIRPCWDTSIWAEQIRTIKAFENLAEAYFLEIRRRKDESARYEMADLELKAMELLRSQPILAQVFSENWDYWMVDEYQDTSPLQVECLRALMADRKVYYVGDPQQSIYLFRGAQVEVFEQAARQVVAIGGEITELRRNWRSEPELLVWMNQFMASVSSAFKPMEPREPAGHNDARPTHVRLLRQANAQEEELAVVGEVARLLSQGATLERVCVLGRTHQTLMEISRALRAYGYPTHVHSARGFSQRREVLDAQALYRFLINPHDNLNLLVLLRSPWFYVSDALLTDWMKERPNSLWRSLVDQQHPQLARLKLILEDMKIKGLVRTFEDTLKSSHMLDLCLQNDPAGRKESNLWKLIHRVRELERQPGAAWLELGEDGRVDVDTDSGGGDGDATSAQEPNCINLMTIHAAKGLEFDHVILPHMGRAPVLTHSRSFTARGQKFSFPVWLNDEWVPSVCDYASVLDLRQRELAEQDRWLYVALTRAKKSVSLIWSEVERNSWASRSRWFDAESDIAEPAQTYRKGGASAFTVRSPWSSPTVASGGSASVTELIQSKNSNWRGDRFLLNRFQAQAKGIKVHKALEALRYGHRLAGYEEIVNYVEQLSHPPLQKILSEGFAEWSFQVKTDQRIVEGQIDLWGKVDGRIYVVDYKSGSQEFKEAAFEQLSLYAWALRRFGHQEPISMAVIYPLQAQVEMRDFTTQLASRWELEFGGAKS